MLQKLAKWILENRAMTLVVVVAIAVLAAAQLPRLQFDFTPQQIFLSASEDFDYRETFAERFGREDNLVFVRVAAPDIYDPSVLRFLRDATEALGELDDVESADSIVTMPLPRAGDEPGSIRVSGVISPDEPIIAERAQRLRELVVAEPLAHGRLVDEAGTRTLIVTRLRTDIQAVDDLRAALADIDVVLSALPVAETPVTGWELRGIPPMRTRVVDELFADQMTFVPIIGVLYALILLVLFRRFAGVALPLAVVGLSLLCLLGLMAAAGSTLNIINNVLPSLVFVIAASDSIHMLQRDAEESARGASRAESVVLTIRHTGLACLLTSVTTAVGFFSLGAADTQLLREFAWQAGVGVLFAFGATIAICGIALASFRPVRRSLRADETSGILGPMAEAVLTHPRIVLALGGLFVAGAVALVTTVRVDARMLDVFGDDPEARQVTDEIQKEFGGVLPIEISLEGDSRQTFSDPRRYGEIDRLQQFAASQPEVLSTQSIIDFHQPVRALLLGDPAERDVMPATREQVAQIQIVLDGEEAAREGTARFVHDEFRNARILVRVADVGGRALRALSARLDDELRKSFGDDPAVTWVQTGDAYIAARSFDAFVRDLLGSLFGAFVVIFALMAVVFRSLRLALIAMVPNALPLLLAAAYMGFAGIPLDVTTMTIFAIGLGLAVDDSIHFIARFREEVAQQPVREALVATYTGAGRAIVLSSVLLFIGMAALQLSNFAPSQIFSTLMMLIIAGAVFADLVILPPLLLLGYRGASRSDR